MESWVAFEGTPGVLRLYRVVSSLGQRGRLYTAALRAVVRQHPHQYVHYGQSIVGICIRGAADHCRSLQCQNYGESQSRCRLVCVSHVHACMHVLYKFCCCTYCCTVYRISSSLASQRTNGHSRKRYFDSRSMLFTVATERQLVSIC